MNLAELFVPDAIQAKQTLADRAAVIQQAGGLLAAAGAVKPEYVGAMQRVMDELGPYCVIAPGIALLHARPEDGVVRSCLGLVTLAKPVVFGHSTNDPVDLAFALGALDKQSHIRALAQLAEYLSQDAFLAGLRKASSDELLKEFIFSYSQAY
jgi:mannitol/fructose-specific phosphotransferase system IIA component (Ntr-type)